MTPWRKKKGLLRGVKYSTTFDPMEREVLGNITATVAEALMARARSAPRDELAEMMDLNPGHKEAPADPSLARLLPDFERDGDEEFDGDNALLRSLHENDIIVAKLENLQAITQAVGPDGGVEVVLEEAEVHQFLAGLNDLRLYLAAAEARTEQEAQDRDSLVEWLAYNQDSLLQALMED